MEAPLDGEANFLREPATPSVSSKSWSRLATASRSACETSTASAVPLLDERANRRDPSRRMRSLTLAEPWQNYLSVSRRSAMRPDRASS